MAIEAKRGCGYRKVGGLYLVGEKGGLPCCKLPILLTVCPCCGSGIKQGRGWQWINPKPWLAASCTWIADPASGMPLCASMATVAAQERVGLLWIGTQFYPRPEDFIREGEAMGISRRIKTVPRGFHVGQDWVFLAHPRVQATEVKHEDGTTETQWTAGVFRIFKPTAIEIIITQTQSQDAEFMADLEKRHLTPVIVPDGDKDHQGTVYDSEDDEPVLPLSATMEA